MTITFPRDMPGTGVALQEFEILRVDYSAPEASGFQGGVQAGFPLWSATWTLGKLGTARSDIWRAWVASLRGRQRPFLGRDFSRPRPLACIHGLPGSWSGDATSWGAAIDAEKNGMLTLTGIPSGLAISLGDYVAFRWTTGGERRGAMVRTVEGATASGGGGATLTVEPPVPACVPPSAVAYLEKPAAPMRLVPEQTQLGGVDRRFGINGGKIVAVQDLRE